MQRLARLLLHQVLVLRCQQCCNPELIAPMLLWLNQRLRHRGLHATLLLLLLLLLRLLLHALR
jgi:hypothetical protein